MSLLSHACNEMDNKKGVTTSSDEVTGELPLLPAVEVEDHHLEADFDDEKAGSGRSDIVEEGEGEGEEGTGTSSLQNAESSGSTEVALTNDIILLLIKGFLGSIPRLGALLIGIADLLWPRPDEHPDQFWKQIEDMIKSLINDLKDQNMEVTTDGLYGVLDEYGSARSVRQMRNLHSFLLARTRELEPAYLRADYWLQLKYLGPLGTLSLLVRRDELDRFEDVHGEPPTTEKIRQVEQRLQSLGDRYLKARNDCLQEAERKRYGAIESGIREFTVRDRKFYVAWVRDTFKGSEFSYTATQTTNKDIAARRRSEQRTNRYHWATVQYVHVTDVLLALSQSWRAIQSTPRNVPTPISGISPVYYHVGPFGSKRYNTGWTYFCDRDAFERHGDLTEVEIRGDRLSSVQEERVRTIIVTYGGNQRIVHGVDRAYSDHAKFVDLKTNRSKSVGIQHVFCRHGDEIDLLGMAWKDTDEPPVESMYSVDWAQVDRVGGLGGSFTYATPMIPVPRLLEHGVDPGPPKLDFQRRLAYMWGAYGQGVIKMLGFTFVKYV